MRTDRVVLAALACLGLTACVSDAREWMKVNQQYTSAEFRRDYRECIRDRAIDEACMRQRGWVPVSPSRTDAPPAAEPSMPRRGRY
jgi:hypothetical protein